MVFLGSINGNFRCNLSMQQREKSFAQRGSFSFLFFFLFFYWRQGGSQNCLEVTFGGSRSRMDGRRRRRRSFGGVQITLPPPPPSDSKQQHWLSLSFESSQNSVLWCHCHDEATNQPPETVKATSPPFFCTQQDNF